MLTLKDSKDKKPLLFIDTMTRFLSEKEIGIILYNLTGCLYDVANGSSARWGENGRIETAEKDTLHGQGFYQIMPTGQDDGFFDWYCEKRAEYQWFDSPEQAAMHFINYWFQWKFPESGEKVKPSKEPAVHG